MGRRAFRFAGLVLALGFSCPVSAHHPPQMERCVIVSFSGQVEQIDWRMPHVELMIQTDDGELRAFIWRSIHQLSWVDIDRDTLKVGDPVVVTATTPREQVGEGRMLLSIIRRTSDGWEWSQAPQGC